MICRFLVLVAVLSFVPLSAQEPTTPAPKGTATMHSKSPKQRLEDMIKEMPPPSPKSLQDQMAKPETPLLDTVRYPADIRRLDKEELATLRRKTGNLMTDLRAELRRRGQF